MFGLTPFERNNHVSSYNPFKEIDDFERNFFGNGVDSIAAFKTDIKDNGKEYILKADLPGFKKEDIHIDAANGYLTIKAERHEEKNEKDNEGNFVRRERSYGSFSRSFDISEVNDDAITAKFENGVLELTLPKFEEKPVASKSIEIS